MRSTLLAAALVLLAGAPMAMAQDSVAVTPGGNDALSSYDAAHQRVRYVVDAASAMTSWGNPIRVAPVLKASRDLDPLFRTQILGSIAVSPDFAAGVTLPSPVGYTRWTTSGGGVHPTANSPTPGVSIGAFDRRFAVALSDFSLAPSSVVTSTIGRQTTDLNRWYVERTVAAASRASGAGADTSTLALGGVDNAGNVTLRADAFGTLAATTSKILGDNVVRISPASRGASVNTLGSASGSNTIADSGAGAYVINNELTATNTPAIFAQAGGQPLAIAFDFLGRFRSGSSTASLVSTTAHAPAGFVHRGNPSFAPVSPALLPGSTGVVAALAIGPGETLPRRLMSFAISDAGNGSAPTIVAGSPRAAFIPSPFIDAQGVDRNPTGQARFTQYLSQTPFRGGSGPVAVGLTSSGDLVLAATATDAVGGTFIAALRYTSPTSVQWTVVGAPSQPVLNGLTGQSIGTIKAGAKFSSPSADLNGNVYFIAEYQPLTGLSGVGLFRSAFTAAGYRLELVLSTGQTIVGQNSTRPYTINQLTLADGDSAASGSMSSAAVMQRVDPLASGRRNASFRRVGGLAVSAVITYDNAGVDESYDAVLFVTPEPGVDCDADFSRSSGVTIDDIFIFLNAWFAGDPETDYDSSGSVSIDDIFIFLNIWFQGC